MVTSRTRAPRIDPDRLDRAVHRVREEVAREAAGPAAFAIATGGEGLVRSEAFGAGVTADSVFPIASITKPIVATVVMQLVEDGRLVLSRPLAEYIPDFAPEAAAVGLPGGEAVTLWHVLTHTSGLGDVRPEIIDRARLGQAGILRLACTSRLGFAPGSRYSYASDPFYLLSATVARSTGMAFAEVLRRQLLDPLGMGSTSFDPRPFGDRFVSLRGLIGDDPPREAVAAWVALEHPGGGLVSTLGDLVRFGQAMIGGGRLGDDRVLGRPFVDLMTREHTAGIREEGVPPRDPHYGLGWDLPGLDRQLPCSPSAFGHRGATGSLFVVDPAYDLVVVFLRNHWGTTSGLQDVALQLVYGALDG